MNLAPMKTKIKYFPLCFAMRFYLFHYVIAILRDITFQLVIYWVYENRMNVFSSSFTSEEQNRV